jgi:hypothetical protein
VAVRPLSGRLYQIKTAKTVAVATVITLAHIHFPVRLPIRIPAVASGIDLHEAQRRKKGA